MQTKVYRIRQHRYGRLQYRHEDGPAQLVDDGIESMARILVLDFTTTTSRDGRYLQRLLVDLPAVAGQHDWIVPLPVSWFDRLPLHAQNVQLEPVLPIHTGIRGLGTCDVLVRNIIDKCRVDLILASGNFGMGEPPVPQVLLNRNAMYFSGCVFTELNDAREMRALLATIMRHRMVIASMRESSRIVVSTAALAENVLHWAPDLQSDRIHVAWPGVDVDGTAQREWETRARATGPSDRVKRILMVGRYHAARNFETLLRAFSYLSRSFVEPVELTLTAKLGFGLTEHGQDTTRAACLIEELGIADRVQVIGPQPFHETRRLLREADVAICPSRTEPTGRLMLRAMASGCPLITADQPAHRELCGNAAEFFDPSDPIDLANRIRQVLVNQELADHLAITGLRRASLFTWRNHFSRVAQAVDDVVASHGISTPPTRRSA